MSLCLHISIYITLNASAHPSHPTALPFSFTPWLNPALIIVTSFFLVFLLSPFINVEWYRMQLTTPVLQQLHWALVKYCINFKVLLQTFKAIHTHTTYLAPLYLSELLHINVSTRTLRSSSLHLTALPARLITIGSRAFTRFAPHLWNSLPTYIRHRNSLTLFKPLKTLFSVIAIHPSNVYITFSYSATFCLCNCIFLFCLVW